MGLLDSGMTMLENTLFLSDGRTVTYSRGTDSVAIAALIGQTEFASDSGDSGAVSFKSRDFIVIADELDFGGGQLTPEAGDTILDGDDTYEVMRIPGQQPFRRSGPSEQILRIYTKLVDVA